MIPRSGTGPCSFPCSACRSWSTGALPEGEQVNRKCATSTANSEHSLSQTAQAEIFGHTLPTEESLWPTGESFGEQAAERKDMAIPCTGPLTCTWSPNIRHRSSSNRLRLCMHVQLLVSLTRRELRCLKANSLRHCWPGVEAKLSDTFAALRWYA